MSTSRPSTTAVIGISRWKPVSPKTGSRTISISSEPYAEEEMQSLDSTPSAAFLDSFSSCSAALTSGLPSSEPLDAVGPAFRQVDSSGTHVVDARHAAGA